MFSSCTVHFESKQKLNAHRIVSLRTTNNTRGDQCFAPAHKTTPALDMLHCCTHPKRCIYILIRNTNFVCIHVFGATCI